MQENPSNEPPTWQSLYGEAKVRIADLQTRLRQESTNSNYLLERYENLERECMEWKDLASEHKENLDMLERENQRLQQEVQTLSRRICDFENIERAFSQTRK
jgi:chromosome segregation ATPase